MGVCIMKVSLIVKVGGGGGEHNREASCTIIYSIQIGTSCLTMVMDQLWMQAAIRVHAPIIAMQGSE